MTTDLPIVEVRVAEANQYAASAHPLRSGGAARLSGRLHNQLFGRWREDGRGRGAWRGVCSGLGLANRAS